jgi:hypothetical protein
MWLAKAQKWNEKVSYPNTIHLHGVLVYSNVMMHQYYKHASHHAILNFKCEIIKKFVFLPHVDYDPWFLETFNITSFKTTKLELGSTKKPRFGIQVRKQGLCLFLHFSWNRCNGFHMCSDACN